MQVTRDLVNNDIMLLLRIPDTVCRTDGEFKWRVLQAITLALTEKESRYEGADTVEGLQGLLRQISN